MEMKIQVGPSSVDVSFDLFVQILIKHEKGHLAAPLIDVKTYCGELQTDFTPPTDVYGKPLLPREDLIRSTLAFLAKVEDAVRNSET